MATWRIFYFWSRYGGAGRVIPKECIETRRLLDQRIKQLTLMSSKSLLSFEPLHPTVIRHRKDDMQSQNGLSLRMKTPNNYFYS